LHARIEPAAMKMAAGNKTVWCGILTVNIDSSR
jgi:hypothetical protein